MPFINLNTITVQGKYLDFTGAPLSGQVKFKPSAALRDSNGDQIILPLDVTATLNADGAFSLVLPATDDTDLTPVGITYTVTESVAGFVRSYDIAVPLNTPNGILDLADIAPSVASTGTETYVLVQTFNDLTNRVNALETGGGAEHPDLATHDAIGLATDAELAAHVTAGHATMVTTSDPRLSDARTPLAHTHDNTTVSGFTRRNAGGAEMVASPNYLASGDLVVPGNIALNWALGNWHIVILDANVTDFDNINEVTGSNGNSGVLIIRQDGVGNRTVVWADNWMGPDGGAPEAPSATANTDTWYSLTGLGSFDSGPVIVNVIAKGVPIA